MQSYISHPLGTVFYHLINFLLSKSYLTDLLRKISEIIENVIFSLIFVLQEILYFRCGKSRKYDIYVYIYIYIYKTEKCENDRTAFTRLYRCITFSVLVDFN